jgi:hypothetical protein
MVCVEDYSQQRSAEQMGITMDSNVYHRPASNQPNYFAVWSRGAGNPLVQYSLPTFSSATGQERRGREFVGAGVVNADGVLTSAVTSIVGAVASPLPGDVAALVGRPADTNHLGIWP